MYLYEDHLESARLKTRFLTPSDAPVWSEFMNDKVATELFPASFFSLDKDPAEAWVEAQINRYNSFRYGLQAILHKQSGEFLGMCGLLLQEVDGEKEIEVGYHFLRKHWGNGYAPEAAKLFLEYAFEHNLASSVISIIDVRNLKSQRVAEKNMLQREKTTRWREMDAYIYRIPTK
jgi:ribosomal-protein-alanine N-acetyltransferase